MVIAGYGNRTHLSSTEIYDPALNRWQEGPALPLAVVHPVAVLGTNGTVYVFGGDRGAEGPTNSAYALTTPTGSWRALSPLPTRRFGSYAEIVGSRILVGGGVGSEDRADLYNPTNNTWTRTADTRTVHIFAGHATLPDGRAIVFGGFQSGTTQPTRSVEIFDPVSEQWTSGPALAGTYGGMGTVRTRDGLIHFAGGFAGAYLSLVQTFTPASSQYQTGTPLPRERGYGTLVELLDGRLLFVGGRNSETLGFADVFTLAPGASAWR